VHAVSLHSFTVTVADIATSIVTVTGSPGYAGLGDTETIVAGVNCACTGTAIVISSGATNSIAIIIEVIALRFGFIA